MPRKPPPSPDNDPNDPEGPNPAPLLPPTLRLNPAQTLEAIRENALILARSGRYSPKDAVRYAINLGGAKPAPPASPSATSPASTKSSSDNPST